jgi:hypothetical protein
MSNSNPMTRRNFANLWSAAAGAALVPTLLEARPGTGTAAAADTRTPAAEEGLKSEFLFDLVLDRGTPNSVASPGGTRLAVPVLDGTFEGPKLKGTTVVGPSSDWIVVRSDGSSVLDMRLLLQTDDAQKISVTWRGIAYTKPDGSLYARILPIFETGAAKYAWLNQVVAVGVYRPVPKRVAYRVFQIL